MEVMSTPTHRVTLGFSEKDHPMWGLLKPLVLTCCVASLLYLFADNFDKTEVKAVIGTLFTSFGLEAFNSERKRRG